jgi:hypothetical protein
MMWLSFSNHLNFKAYAAVGRLKGSASKRALRRDRQSGEMVPES